MVYGLNIYNEDGDLVMDEEGIVSAQKMTIDYFCGYKRLYQFQILKDTAINLDASSPLIVLESFRGAADATHCYLTYAEDNTCNSYEVISGYNHPRKIKMIKWGMEDQDDTAAISFQTVYQTNNDIDSFDFHVYYKPGAPYELLLHCDGADGGQVFIDDGYIGHTVTANGTAQIDTDQKKFGTGSAQFPGTAGNNLSISSHASLSFGLERFTIDFWFCFDSPIMDFYYGFFGQFDGGGANWGFFWERDTLAQPPYNRLRFEIVSGGVTIINLVVGVPTPQAGTWYHLAVIRGWGDDDDKWAITLNGAMKNETTVADAMPVFSSNFLIGEAGFAVTKGRIDEFRIVKGQALWTENFTPPGAPAEHPSGIPSKLVWTWVEHDPGQVLSHYAICWGCTDLNGDAAFAKKFVYESIETPPNYPVGIACAQDNENRTIVYWIGGSLRGADNNLMMMVLDASGNAIVEAKEVYHPGISTSTDGFTLGLAIDATNNTCHLIHRKASVGIGICSDGASHSASTYYHSNFDTTGRVQDTYEGPWNLGYDVGGHGGDQTIFIPGRSRRLLFASAFEGDVYESWLGPEDFDKYPNDLRAKGIGLVKTWGPAEEGGYQTATALCFEQNPCDFTVPRFMQYIMAHRYGGSDAYDRKGTQTRIYHSRRAKVEVEKANLVDLFTAMLL